MNDSLLAKFPRKILHKNAKNTSPKISVPRWWVKSADEVILEIYPDKIIIHRIERAKDDYLRAV